MNYSIHCTHRKVGEAGLQHKIVEVAFSLADLLDLTILDASRMTGMKDFSFPREMMCLANIWYDVTYHFFLN